MGIPFKDTEKQYYVLVNRPELLKRAEELGYEGVSLYTGDELDSEAVAAAMKNDKAVLRILYRPDREENDGGRFICRHFENSDKADVVFDLYGYEDYMDDEDAEVFKVRSIEDAVKYFPAKELMEMRLKSRRIIKETDYTDRCGNCAAFMDKKDKYCRYCGTERGKGKFESFENVSDIVYGPPVKMKYKCSACGYIWITGIMGGDHCNYCPSCGKRKVKTVETRYDDFMLWAIGTEEPFDPAEKPVLFTEEEVKNLLDQRKEISKTEDNYPQYISRETILNAMRKAGVNVPPDVDPDRYPRTEKEGDQIYLADIILRTEGSNPTGCKDIRCSYCGSSLLALPKYEILDDRYKTLVDGLHAPAAEDPVVCTGTRSITHREIADKKKNSWPAYICMKCGTEFGEIEIPQNCRFPDDSICP